MMLMMLMNGESCRKEVGWDVGRAVAMVPPGLGDADDGDPDPGYSLYGI